MPWGTNVDGTPMADEFYDINGNPYGVVEEDTSLDTLDDSWSDDEWSTEDDTSFDDNSFDDGFDGGWDSGFDDDPFGSEW